VTVTVPPAAVVADAGVPVPHAGGAVVGGVDVVVVEPPPDGVGTQAAAPRAVIAVTVARPTRTARVRDGRLAVEEGWVMGRSFRSWCDD
jgi:hypothetical protein